LIEILGDILRLIVQLLPGHQGEEWVKVIGVYVMSVNKNISESEYKQTLKSVFPTQFEPGSLADRLLTQGREEGREKGFEEGREEGREEGLERGKMAGKIQLIQGERSAKYILWCVVGSMVLFPFTQELNHGSFQRFEQSRVLATGS
jgi:predicted transposase YdaD